MLIDQSGESPSDAPILLAGKFLRPHSLRAGQATLTNERTAFELSSM
jgi:hypothetical protein